MRNVEMEEYMYVAARDYMYIPKGPFREIVIQYSAMYVFYI